MENTGIDLNGEHNPINLGNYTKSEKRNYPIERKLAPTWQCPVCDKIMSSRGKVGHLEKAHGRAKPLNENDPFPIVHRQLIQKNRPLSRADVRNLISNVLFLLNDTTPYSNLIKIRKSMLQCEYLIRELEINFNCTLEEAVKKFPELQQITGVTI